MYMNRRPVGVVVQRHAPLPDREDHDRADEREDADCDGRSEPVDVLDPVELDRRRARQPLEEERDERQEHSDDDAEGDELDDTPAHRQRDYSKPPRSCGDRSRRHRAASLGRWKRRNAPLFVEALPGPLAQLVEQGTLNPKVEGSNPSRPMGTVQTVLSKTKVAGETRSSPALFQRSEARIPSRLIGRRSWTVTDWATPRAGQAAVCSYASCS